MADRVIVDAETRSTFGKKSKQLRREGMIPAVIYGKRDPVHIQVENLLLRRALRQAGRNELININVGGKTVTVLARDIQQHPTRGDLVHVDFYEVDMRQTIQADITIITTGETAEEVRQLGQVVQVLHAVTVECLPGDLVSEIEVDISAATPDNVIYVSDITAPAGMTILTEPETAITSFDYFREEEEEEAEEETLFGEEGEEVEVIAKGKAADEDEEETEEEEG